MLFCPDRGANFAFFGAQWQSKNSAVEGSCRIHSEVSERGQEISVEHVMVGRGELNAHPCTAQLATSALVVTCQRTWFFVGAPAAGIFQLRIEHHQLVASEQHGRVGHVVHGIEAQSVATNRGGTVLLAALAAE